MLCDTLHDDEIFEAFLLYASLHGMCTEESVVRSRIEQYRNNQPDWLIDDAILAYLEDRVVAPPDIVLPCWGKSRLYELVRSPCGSWHHQVSEAWFDNGCRFHDDDQDPSLAHFWTELLVPRRGAANVNMAWPVGTRLQLRIEGKAVAVVHRHDGLVGWLSQAVAEEMSARQVAEPRYLTLIDSLEDGDEWWKFKLLIVVARRDQELDKIVKYAQLAFHAVRNKC